MVPDEACIVDISGSQISFHLNKNYVTSTPKLLLALYLQMQLTVMSWRQCTGLILSYFLPALALTQRSLPLLSCQPTWKAEKIQLLAIAWKALTKPKDHLFWVKYVLLQMVAPRSTGLNAILTLVDQSSLLVQSPILSESPLKVRLPCALAQKLNLQPLFSCTPLSQWILQLSFFSLKQRVSVFLTGNQNLSSSSLFPILPSFEIWKDSLKATVEAADFLPNLKVSLSEMKSSSKMEQDPLSS